MLAPHRPPPLEEALNHRASPGLGSAVEGGRTLATGRGDRSRGPAWSPPAEGRSGTRGRELSRPVTFRTARPLARPPPGPLSASRNGSVGPPCTSAFQQRPPGTPEPRPRPSALPVPAEKAREAVPPSSRGLGLRVPGYRGGAARACLCEGRCARSRVWARAGPKQGRARAAEPSPGREGLGRGKRGGTTRASAELCRP